MPRVVRDGVALHYQEAGTGDPPLVLLHGWCCDHTYLAPQIEHLQRGHRVVALDLRGHGQSDKPQQLYTIEGFADDVAWLCSQLALAKPVVVGHSMGGIVALDLAARYPDLPAAIAMLDAATVPPPTTGDAIQRLLAALRGPAYREAQRQYVARVLFIPTDDAVRRERILDAMSAAPQQVMASAMESVLHYDSVSAARACRVPALYICANDTRPRSDLARFRELCPQLMVGQTVGSGHFCQLEVPEQVNAMLDRFLAISLPRSAN